MGEKFPPLKNINLLEYKRYHKARRAKDRSIKFEPEIVAILTPATTRETERQSCMLRKISPPKRKRARTLLRVAPLFRLQEILGKRHGTMVESCGLSAKINHFYLYGSDSLFSHFIWEELSCFTWKEISKCCTYWRTNTARRFACRRTSTSSISGVNYITFILKNVLVHTYNVRHGRVVLPYMKGLFPLVGNLWIGTAWDFAIKSRLWPKAHFSAHELAAPNPHHGLTLGFMYP